MAAGKLVLEGGSFILDSSVYEQGEKLTKMEIEAEVDKRRKQDLNYMKVCYDTNKAYAIAVQIRRWTVVKIYAPGKKFTIAHGVSNQNLSNKNYSSFCFSKVTMQITVKILHVVQLLLKLLKNIQQ